MYRILVIVLLALLPVQFTWAAVASYCGHESEASATHFGHHAHDHADSAEASSMAGVPADPSTDVSSTPDDFGGAEAGKAPDATDLDCSHCHGACSVMLTAPLGLLPGELSTVSPMACIDEASGAHAPTRPERPQWMLLA